jgi:hypothetical protein
MHPLASSQPTSYVTCLPPELSWKWVDWSFQRCGVRACPLKDTGSEQFLNDGLLSGAKLSRERCRELIPKPGRLGLEWIATIGWKR